MDRVVLGTIATLNIFPKLWEPLTVLVTSHSDGIQLYLQSIYVFFPKGPRLFLGVWQRPNVAKWLQLRRKYELEVERKSTDKENHFKMVI